MIYSINLLLVYLIYKFLILWNIVIYLWHIVGLLLLTSSKRYKWLLLISLFWIERRLNWISIKIHGIGPITHSIHWLSHHRSIYTIHKIRLLTKGLLWIKRRCSNIVIILKRHWTKSTLIITKLIWIIAYHVSIVSHHKIILIHSTLIYHIELYKYITVFFALLLWISEKIPSSRRTTHHWLNILAWWTYLSCYCAAHTHQRTTNLFIAIFIGVHYHVTLRT